MWSNQSWQDSRPLLRGQSATPVAVHQVRKARAREVGQHALPEVAVPLQTSAIPTRWPTMPKVATRS
ncbi:hypothetical protein TSAR_015230 [Trichomalopsis sarcophagae]|uniref:Uncharacterized protein n=1 Tax=Trichomalopsis sarcophagae TaxID=543379 RepID=A0A232EDU6_9HYME|nr:hypothetical protein TSAR_015230 [Trichomalopsis sarcophagae]